MAMANDGMVGFFLSK